MCGVQLRLGYTVHGESLKCRNMIVFLKWVDFVFLANTLKYVNSAERFPPSLVSSKHCVFVNGFFIT